MGQGAPRPRRHQGGVSRCRGDDLRATITRPEMTRLTTCHSASPGWKRARGRRRCPLGFVIGSGPLEHRWLGGTCSAGAARRRAVMDSEFQLGRDGMV